MSYKRNQIEEAIARLFVPNCREPPSELRTGIKRLLELDRSIGRKRRSKDAEEANYGFFSDEAPGTGVDISFSEYEAFALLNALRIMEHGWPQSFAVSIMHRARSGLEVEHARILRQRPDELFNLQAIRKRARPGDIAVDNADPVFLTIASKAQRGSDEARPSPMENGGAGAAAEAATKKRCHQPGMVRRRPAFGHRLARIETAKLEKLQAKVPITAKSKLTKQPKPRRKLRGSQRPGHWLLQDAKARFSELVRRVRSEGPQHVTVCGRDEGSSLQRKSFAASKAISRGLNNTRLS